MPLPAALLASAGGMGGDMLTKFAGSFNQLTAMFETMGNSIGKFVSAINPGLMQIFNQTMQSLNATIGVALEPVMQALIPVVQGVADAMLPLMRQLAPIIGVVTKSFEIVAQKMIDGFAAIFQALMPVIDIVGKMVGVFAQIVGTGIATVLQLVASLLEDLVSALTELLAKSLGVDVKDAADALVRAFQQLVRNVVLVAAKLMMMVGFTKGVDALIKAVSGAGAKRESAVGLAVAQNPQFKSIEEVGRGVQQAAFAASIMGGKKEMKTEDYLAGITDQLKDIRAGIGVEELKKEIIETLTALPTKMVKAIKEWWDGNKKGVYEGASGVAVGAGVGTFAPGIMAARRLFGM